MLQGIKKVNGGHNLQVIRRYHLAIFLAAFLAQQLSSTKNPFHVQSKDDQTAVSERDKNFDTFIRQQIAKRFPKDNVISEEGRKLASGTCWIADSIDGSENDANGILLRAVSISYWVQNRPTFAAVAIPDVAGYSVISCLRQNGIYVNENKHIITQPERRLGAVEFSRANHDAQEKYPALIKVFDQIDVFGSSVFAGTITALGKASFFMNTNPKLWDIASTLVFAQEVGLKLSQTEFDVAAIAQTEWRSPLFIAAQNDNVLGQIAAIMSA